MNLNVEKVLALPTGAAILPNTMYLVKIPGTKFFEIFISDNAGQEVLSEEKTLTTPQTVVEPFSLLGVAK